MAFADGITNGLGIAGDSIYKYTPAVQSLGYVIACLIGIVGAFSIYYAIQNNDPRTRKKILTYAGSCFTMVAMSISLPKFFAYQESGLIAGNQGNGGTGGTGNQVGGDNYDDIITEIPPLTHPSWRPDPQYPIIKPGGNMGDITIINPELKPIGPVQQGTIRSNI